MRFFSQMFSNVTVRQYVKPYSLSWGGGDNVGPFCFYILLIMQACSYETQT